MTREEIVRTLTEAHNFLYDIKVSGEDVYRMANALSRVRGVVDELKELTKRDDEMPIQKDERRDGS